MAFQNILVIASILFIKRKHPHLYKDEGALDLKAGDDLLSHG